MNPKCFVFFLSFYMSGKNHKNRDLGDSCRNKKKIIYWWLSLLMQRWCSYKGIADKQRHYRTRRKALTHCTNLPCCFLEFTSIENLYNILKRNIYLDERQFSKNLIKSVDGRRLELILNMDNAFRINVGFINLLSLFHYNNLFLFLFKFLKIL